MDVVMVEERENDEMRGNNEGLRQIERWDRVLPKNPLRILLVEADDSTRQIIGALLRKCNYKVASVSDGLKAWELLKARHDSIDLVLTEVELPSISGYALLTLISEHEVCKKIPVIMISNQDSVNMVYKCMLKGAADFLVKPIRINELRNLWQHVWRRQSMNQEGLGPQDESFTHEKLEASAENPATSDLSSSSKSCAPPRQEECIKKPDPEAESTYETEGADHLDYQQEKSHVSDLKIQEHSNCANSSKNLCTPENVNLYPEASNGNICNSSREAIDLIGNFDNRSRQNSYSNGGNTNKFDSSQRLDLSLRRYQPGALEIDTTHEKQMLNHSNASAFTRYVTNTLYTNSKAKDTDNIPDSKTMSLCTNLETDAENHALHNLFPIPFPAMSPRVCSPSSTSQSPCSGNQQNNYFHQFSNEVIDGRPQFHHPLEQSPRISSNQPMSKQEQRLESSEDGTQFTSPADQSPSSAFCNGTTTQHFNGSWCPSSANDAVVPGVSDSGSEPLYCQRSIQRKAALTKFRLKRKERCFEKKVRYESRKKLAEQRPRVKGQFVRQAPCDPSTTRN